MVSTFFSARGARESSINPIINRSSKDVLLPHTRASVTVSSVPTRMRV